MATTEAPTNTTPTKRKPPAKSPAKRPAAKAPAIKVVGGVRGSKLKAVPAPPPTFDFEAALEKMDDKFVTCRDFMHAWKPYTARYQPTERTYRSTVKCDRCGTFKIRILSRQGAILDSWYDYPDGYLLPGCGRLNTSDRDRIRLRSIKGVLGAEEAAEAETETEAVEIEQVQQHA